MLHWQALRQAAAERLLVAFEIPAYRRFWLSSLLNSSGSWVMRLAVGWLALELTDSPFWVGLVAALEGVGQMGFGVFSGVLVDRFDVRKVLIGGYLATGLLMLAVGLLVVTGWIAPWHLLPVAALRGVLFSVQSTASSALLYHIAGRARLMNATAMKMLSFNLARIAGSALGGALIAGAGAGPAHLAAGALTCTAALPLLLLAGSFKSTAAPAGAAWRAAGQGIRYVWRNAPVRALWLLSAVVETFAFSYNTMTPVIARDVLGVGAAGLGTLSAAGGVGAVLGTFVTLGLSRTRRKAGWLLAGAGGAGLALVLFALSRSLLLSLLLMAAVSLALVVYDVLMNTLILLLADDKLRGRVLSLYTLTFGFNAGGGLAAGAIASSLGAPAAVAAIGGVVLAYVLAAFKTVRRIQPAESETPA